MPSTIGALTAAASTARRIASTSPSVSAAERAGRTGQHALDAQAQQRHHGRPRVDAGPARLELAHEDVGGDGFAVDQHAVAIADQHARFMAGRRHLTART
jgi:hypothetical protein